MHERRLIIVIILLTIISVVSSILVNLATDYVPDSWTPYLWVAWPLLVVTMIVIIVLTIIQVKAGNKVKESADKQSVVALHDINTKSEVLQIKSDNEFEYDVFISYSSKDRAWIVENLLPRLEAQGMRICIDFKNFVPGLPSVKEIERVLQSSRKTILVITSHYLRSEWAEFEQLMLQTLEPTNRSGRLIPILIESCDLPLRLRYLTYIDFSDAIDINLAWDRLLFSIESRSTTYSPKWAQREDWGDAPDLGQFFDRDAEINELGNWIVSDKCRLITIWGMGGIGKTSLTIKLALNIKRNFDFLLWRSLRDSPSLGEVLTDCINLISNQREFSEGKRDIESKILTLTKYLKQYRCLIVLDNVETVLSEKDGLNPKNKDYSTFIKHLAEIAHEGCLLLTSRENPNILRVLEGRNSPIRSYKLDGISPGAARKLLEGKDLDATEETWNDFVEFYAGNPLVLKQISATIDDLFDGNIAAFLREGSTMFGDVRVHLQGQFTTLSDIEKSILFWFAIEREPITISGLFENIVPPITKNQLIENLESLKRKAFVEQTNTLFSIRPVVMEFITDYFIEKVLYEIRVEEPNLFNTHLIVKAHSKDFIRDSQTRLILRPIVDRVVSSIGTQGLLNKLNRILLKIKSEAPNTLGYSAANSISILSILKIELSKLDFSSLSIAQAYLQDVNLHDVNFSNTSIHNSIFTDTFGSILSVAFNRDGNMFAIGTTNGEIRIYDFPNCKQIMELYGHTDWVWSIAFGNNNLLASASGDHTVRLWNLTTGTCSNIILGHTNQIRSVVFSPDGSLLASAGHDETIRLWNPQTGEFVRFIQKNGPRLWSLVFNPDGSSIAAGNENGDAKIWKVETGEHIALLSGHTDSVRSICYSPDGGIIATGSGDGTICLWDVKNEEILTILIGHTNSVWTTAFSPGNHLLASGGSDQSIRLWDVTTGECVRVLQSSPDLSSQIRSVVFSSDGKMLISGSENQILQIWDVNTGHPIKTIKGYTNPIWSLAISSVDNNIIGGYGNGSIQIWDINNASNKKIIKGHQNIVWAVSVNREGNLVASGSEDRTVRLWDIDTGECVTTLEGHTDRIWAVPFSPIGDIIASCGDDHTVRLWDWRKGICLSILSDHTNRVRTICFSQDGQLLASGGDDQIIKIRDGISGNSIKALTGHTHRIWSLAFGKENTLLVSGSEDGTARIWDTDTSECIRVLVGHKSRVKSVAINPTNKLIATGGGDHAIRLWDCFTGECVNILSGHTHPIRSLAFSTDGSYLVSASGDETIRIWDIKTGECTRVIWAEKPYERMNISGISGLSAMERISLKTLGASEN